MKLIKLEHPEKGIWYFTNLNRAAMYIKSSYSNLRFALNRERITCKGWTVEEIESDEILSKYINPE